MKAADQLWIISRLYHGGYAFPSNGNEFDLPTCGYALPVPSMVDMLTIAMGRLLPAMDMDRPLPECPMVDMLLLTTIMDMPLSTKDSSTMGQDMNTNT